MKPLLPMAELDHADRRVVLPDNRLCATVFGQHHSHLARMEQLLPVNLVARGNEVIVHGDDPDAVNAAATVLQELYVRARGGEQIGRNEVDATVRMVTAGEPSPTDGYRGQQAAVRTERKLVVPRTPNQARYLEALQKNDLVLGLGPAGTGKTYLAVAAAVAAMKARTVERLILSRPAVEAGERLGFLPGDMREKVDPYLRPIYDALHDLLPEGRLERAIETGQIEIAPLAFMRGRTLRNAAVILDEAQNATPMQMKMFLTRLGENSRMVVTGDPNQSDLPHGVTSGLQDAVDRLSGIDGIAVVRFDASDIVRHPLVQKIVQAYEPHEPPSATFEDGVARTLGRGPSNPAKEQ
ncbi:PhoH family protein [Geminicoccus harenae]|uniref:PhoH family protein n=1 Tax=Geminicoccus harenae TaxID=2498453 RepID=UPI001CC2E6DF|nr:PhoH family protein [Geminicoccus harenae]